MSLRAQRGEQVERTSRVWVALWCLLAIIACSGGREEALPDEGAPTDAEPVREGDRAVAERGGADTLVMQVGGLLPEPPVAPLRIEGACPFECCTYGNWTATGKTTVYEEPDPRSPQRTVSAGTRLEAVSGFVVLTKNRRGGCA